MLQAIRNPAFMTIPYRSFSQFQDTTSLVDLVSEFLSAPPWLRDGLGHLEQPGRL